MLLDYGYTWVPWIDHNGSGCPVEIDYDADTLEALVQVERRRPNSEYWLVDEAHHIDWQHCGDKEDVVRYRLEIGYWNMYLDCVQREL